MDVQLQVTDKELEEFPEDKFDHTSLDITNKANIRADIDPPTADLPIPTTNLPTPPAGLPKSIAKQRCKAHSKTTNSRRTLNQQGSRRPDR